MLQEHGLLVFERYCLPPGGHYSLTFTVQFLRISNEFSLTRPDEASTFNPSTHDHYLPYLFCQQKWD